VRRESSLFRRKAGSHAFLFDTRSDPGRFLSPGAKTEPHDTCSWPAAERADIAELDVERRRWAAGQCVGNAFHHRAAHAADEPDGQVEILDRRPPEVRRDIRTRSYEARQLRALRVGHGKREERADPQRTRVFFFQFS